MYKRQGDAGQNELVGLIGSIGCLNGLGSVGSVVALTVDCLLYTSKILPTAITSLPASFSRSSMVARGGFRLRSWRLVVR